MSTKSEKKSKRASSEGATEQRRSPRLSAAVPASDIPPVLLGQASAKKNKRDRDTESTANGDGPATNGKAEETAEERAARRAAKRKLKDEAAGKKAEDLSDVTPAKKTKGVVSGTPTTSPRRKSPRFGADMAMTISTIPTLDLAKELKKRQSTGSKDKDSDKKGDKTPTRKSPRLNAGVPVSGAPPAMDLAGSSSVEILPVAEYKRKHDITVKGKNVPDPVQDFAATTFPPEILSAIKTSGFIQPSPIQAQCWPLALRGDDLIAIAKTGSGKTCGYLLPAFVHIKAKLGKNMATRRGDGPLALAMAPTRELAQQIEVECVKFSKGTRIVSACLFGGVPKGPQIGIMMRGVHIVIATPGRLNDFLEMENPPVTNLERCSYLVLDEADRMLDMGFEPQIRTIINKIKEHQTLMFTATWPKAVQKLASEFLNNPTQINIGSADVLVVNENVTQEVHKLSESEKDEKLKEVMAKIKEEDNAKVSSGGKPSSIIVFVNRKGHADRVASLLRRSCGFTAQSIHGDKDQFERQQALEAFTKGGASTIVATDVAARGLDIKGVSHVINYDFPTGGVEDWVHRVGRTARAGEKGIAITFFDPDQNKRSAAELLQILQDAKQPIPPWLGQMARRYGGYGGGGSSRWGGGRGGGGSGGWRGGRGGRGGSFGGRGGSRGGGRGSFGGGRGRGGSRGRGGY